MEGQGSPRPQVSEGSDGTSVAALLGRCLSWPESEPGTGSWGQGGASIAEEHKDCMGRHTGCPPSQVLSRVGEDHCPCDLWPWLFSSRHPSRGHPGTEGAAGQRICGEWLEAAGARCQTLRAELPFHLATEEYLGT